MNKIEEMALSYVGKNRSEIDSRYPAVREGAWCAAAVCCILNDCGIDVYKSISCTQMANKWATDPRMQRAALDEVQSGDILFFDWDSTGDCDHIAIVVEYDGNVRTGLYYVNGNGNDPNTVTKQYMTYGSLQKNVGRIFRYVGSAQTKSDIPATPNKTENKKVSITLNQVSEGDVNKSVKLLQSLLISEGYSCGPCGADGDFGQATDQAVRKYQLAKGLDVDGAVGQQTWSSLLT